MFGKHLPNHRTLQDAGIYRSGETLLLEIHTGHQGLVIGTDSILNPSTSILQFISTSDVYISSSLLDLTPKAFRRIIQQARRGLAVGLKPDFVLDGSGGTYILHDTRKRPIVASNQVHKIAILNIRILNSDRNAASLLCVGDASWFDWCWLNWAQMKELMSKATQDYVLKLNIEDD